MLRIDNLSKSFGTKAILADVSYHFPIGERIALVGPNGAGKTTLLRILAGEDEADHGHIERPKDFTLAYLPQVPNLQPQATVIEECLVGGSGTTQQVVLRYRSALDQLTHGYSAAAQDAFDHAEARYLQIGGHSLEATAKGVLKGLGFRLADFDKDPRDLSGGWRMRIELAKILVHPSDFLILDEPTNHLDLPSLVWVEKFLRSYRGTLLLVSHDRSLLERLPTVTLHLHRGKMMAYRGNFSAFLEEKERQEETEAAAATNLRKRREHLEKFVERFGAKATKARQAQSRIKMIARIKDLEKDVVADDDPASMVLQLPEPPSSGKLTLTLKDFSIGYDRVLSRGINLEIQRGQRIAVVGLNGIGKSTLLKTICGEVQPLAGTLAWGHQVQPAYFAQDQEKTLDPSRTVLAEVQSVNDRVSDRQARTILGHFLFSGDDVHKITGVLSGGEKSRVGLARLLLQPANFLLLDEPTNHLDISSVEVLAGALADYEGSLLFVSHDRSFIDAVATHIFAMLPDGRAALFEGSLEDYSRLASHAGLPNVFEASLEVASPAAGVAVVKEMEVPSADEVGQLRKERSALEKKQKQLDRRLSDLQVQMAGLDSRLLTTGISFNESQKIGSELARCREEIEASEEVWIEGGANIELINARLKKLGRL